MKRKVYALFVAVMVVMVLSACSKDSNTENVEAFYKVLGTVTK